jgi:hypothetical protein
MWTWPWRALVGVWNWLGSYKDQVTIVLAVSAGFLAFCEYRAKIDDDKKKETLKYVELTQAEVVVQAQERIWDLFLETDLGRAYDVAAKSPDVHALGQFVEKENLKQPILALAQLYANLSACVAAEVCDEALACRFFEGDIVALNNNFHQLFEKTWKDRIGFNYMAASMDFAKRCRRSQATEARP